MRLLLWLGLALGAGCVGHDARMPARAGFALEVRPAPQHVPRDPTALQIRWLGTTCYALELGGLCVLTDPFVSTGTVYPWSFGSQPDEVARRLAPLDPAPQALFVTEGHVDHALDAHAALGLWPQAQLYGSRTVRHLLAGFGLDARAHDVAAVTSGELLEPEAGRFAVRWRAFPSAHTPHFESGWTFLGGVLDEPLDEPPGFWDYQAGEATNYLFSFTGGARPLNVFLLNAPHSRRYPLPPADTPIDVLLLLTPSTATVEGDYPAEWIERLQPRVVILAHFDDFLARRDYDRDPPVEVLYEADVLGVLLEAQRAAERYPGCERIVVPALSDPTDRRANTVVRIALPE
ncbi:MAG: MBL fold metallo-hydrolase [Planctomycetota bacterium]